MAGQTLESNTQLLAQLAEGSRDGSGPAWLYPLRQEAGSRFAELGFPTRRDEEWRFTNISAVVGTSFQLAPQAQAAPDNQAIVPFLFAQMPGTRLVFINGHYAPALSVTGTLPEGVKVVDLATAFNSDAALIEPYLGRYAEFESQAFVALNTAALDDGAFISIPRNTVVEEPIHLVYFSTASETPTVSHPRTLIVVGESAQVTIVESYAGIADSVYFTNAVTEVIAGANSQIDHYKLQRESKKAYHIATMQVQISANANFSSHSIGLGGALARSDANAVLGASGIECTLNGLYMGTGTQIIDNHTMIDHAMPYCNSHEIYKGILDDKSRGVFNGKIFVRPDAQKTDAKQTNQTLLLSDGAQIDTKPQLEIYADDVKCTHGATIGQLSAEALFYLRARGIPVAEARSLLTYAFASDIVSRIKIEEIREQLDLALLAEREIDGI